MPPDDTLTGTGEVLATATFEIDPDLVKPDTLRNMLTWAGAWVGIGASRKMGWGRFSVASWDVVLSLAAPRTLAQVSTLNTCSCL